MSNAMLKRWLLLVGVLVAGVAIMVGCAAPAAVPAAPAAEGTEAAAPEAAPGEKSRLVIAQSVDVESFEPSQVNSRAESNMFEHMYATLFKIAESGDIVPYLAKEYTMSEDGTEWTFTLNEGLTCHDGEPLTAEDVVYTFQRAADPANGFTGNTAGFVLDALKYKDARVDGDLQATIVTESYSPIGLGLISEVFIHCKDSYSALSLEEAAAKPIGSGPYRFVEWVKDDHVLMEKVEGFPLRDVGYDELEWKVIPEASTRAAELIAGNVDIITNVAPDQHAAVNESGVAAVTGVSGTRRMYVGYNQRDIFGDDPGAAAIEDPKVRVALQYAVDVPTICQTLLGFACERASSMVNPPNNNTNLTPYPYDPAMAEKLLDEAGYPRGEDGTRFPITFMSPRGRYLNDVAVGQAIAQYLSDVGLAVDHQVLDWGSDFVPKLRAHEVGPLFFVGTGGALWAAAYDLADISEPTGATNYTEWNNQEWFDLVAQIGDARTPEALKEVTDKMQEVFYNDPPWLLLYFQPDFYGVANDVDWQPRRDEIIDVLGAKPLQ